MSLEVEKELPELTWENEELRSQRLAWHRAQPTMLITIEELTQSNRESSKAQEELTGTLKALREQYASDLSSETKKEKEKIVDEKEDARRPGKDTHVSVSGQE